MLGRLALLPSLADRTYDTAEPRAGLVLGVEAPPWEGGGRRRSTYRKCWHVQEPGDSDGHAVPYGILVPGGRRLELLGGRRTRHHVAPLSSTWVPVVRFLVHAAGLSGPCQDPGSPQAALCPRLLTLQTAQEASEPRRASAV